MRKHIKKILIALLALIVLCACVWRLRPHSLADIISVDESAIISLACTANISGVSEDGTPFIDNYELQALTGDSKDFMAVVDQLSKFIPLGNHICQFKWQFYECKHFPCMGEHRKGNVFFDCLRRWKSSC